MEGRGSQDRTRNEGYRTLSASASPVINVAPVRYPTGRELQLQAARRRARIHTFTGCDLHRDTDRPVAFRGAHRGACEPDHKVPAGVDCTGFSLVGEAPGKQEVEQGMPFVGRSGKLLRAMLTKAGFDWDYVSRMNTICCWPKAKGRTRGPYEKEQFACRGNLMEQLRISGWQYVLLVGSHALGAFRSDLKVSEVHGSLYVWMNQWIVMPIFHPAAILRNPGLKSQTVEDLTRWYSVIQTNELSIPDSTMCSRCGGTATMYDPDGVGYCERHWKKWGTTWKKQRARWTDKKLEVKDRRGKWMTISPDQTSLI